MQAAAQRSRGPRSRTTVAALLLAAALLAAGFAALGSWQLQRLAWKTDLIARVAQRTTAPAQPAPGPAAWPGLSRAADEYRRVAVHGRYAHDLATRVRAVTALGSGHWLLTPVRTDAGHWVLVNRGFVPHPGRAPDGALLPVPLTEPAGAQTVVGLLRLTEPGGAMLQANDPAADRWTSRDVPAIARARGLGDAPVAPYFIDAVPGTDTPPTATGWPRPGLTVLAFSNSHLSYALTWFVLAAMVLAAGVYVLHTERQLRRAAADSGPHD